MSRVCTVCRHPQRLDIDKALVAPQPNLREIARRYSLKPDALRRHKESHIPPFVAHAAELVKIDGADQIAVLMTQLATGSKSLWDACHEYLEDPERPGKFYLGPRGEDIWVVLEWWTVNDQGKTIRHRERQLLHNIVQTIEERTGRTVVNTSWKHSDPRELILKASDNLLKLIDTIVKVQAEAREQRKEDLTKNPEFIRYQNAVASVLRRYPGALDALMEALEPVEPGAQRELAMEEL